MISRNLKISWKCKMYANEARLDNQATQARGARRTIRMMHISIVFLHFHTKYVGIIFNFKKHFKFMLQILLHPFRMDFNMTHRNIFCDRNDSKIYCETFQIIDILIGPQNFKWSVTLKIVKLFENVKIRKYCEFKKKIYLKFQIQILFWWMVWKFSWIPIVTNKTWMNDDNYENMKLWCVNMWCWREWFVMVKITILNWNIIEPESILIGFIEI